MKNYLNKIQDINPLYNKWLTYDVEPCIESIPNFMESGNPECKVEYILNSNGMRCDEFAYNKVLFAGCEYTMPIHQEVQHGWAYNLYQNVFQNDSKYIALSYPGSSLDRIVGNIFKYFNNYGNPEYLFVLAPEINRATGYWNENKVFKPKIYRQFSSNLAEEHNKMAEPNNMPLELMVLNYFTSIRNLEIYCKNNNIKMFWTSWDLETNILLKEYNFNNYISVNNYFTDSREISALFKEAMDKNVTA